MTKVETIFQKELSLIHDQKIKQFVIDCFDKLCPDYFWTCPCSTTGKYHPQIALGIGGLVRHTKLAVWWGLELLKALSYELTAYIQPQQLQDEVIATLLLHDMIKNGKGLNARGYPLERDVTGTHGVTLANKINNEALDHKLDNCPSERILTGIAGHMGIWTTSIPDRPGNLTDETQRAFAQLIHLADYCASRKVDEIYRKLQGEKDDPIKQTTDNQKTTTPCPPCPGIRKTKSCQTES